MKVVVVGPYPRDPDRIANGVEAVIVYLLEGLRRIEGLDVEVVSGQKGQRQADTRRDHGFSVHYLPSPRRLGNLTFDIVEKLRTLRKVEDLRPDVVHIHNHANYPYLLTPPPCPTVTTVHGLIFREVAYDYGALNVFRRLPRRALERLVLRRAKELVAVTPYVSQMIRPLTSARIRLLENPVSERYFRIDSFTEEHPDRLLFAGSLSELKNVLGLLRILRVLKGRLPSVQLRLAGGARHAGYLQLLKNFVHANQLEPNVAFLGHLFEVELLTEYARSSLVVSCSHEETSGMIVQQAMAAGKAAVVSNVGGFACVVKQGESGFLVDTNDLDGFADRIHLLLRDVGLRRRMGSNARQDAVRRFTPAAAAEKTFAVYQELAAGSLRRSVG